MLVLTRLIGLSLFLFVLAGAVLAQENPAGIYPQNRCLRLRWDQSPQSRW